MVNRFDWDTRKVTWTDIGSEMADIECGLTGLLCSESFGSINL